VSYNKQVRKFINDIYVGNEAGKACNVDVTAEASTNNRTRYAFVLHKVVTPEAVERIVVRQY